MSFSEIFLYAYGSHLFLSLLPSSLSHPLPPQPQSLVLASLSSSSSVVSLLKIFLFPQIRGNVGCLSFCAWHILHSMTSGSMHFPAKSIDCYSLWLSSILFCVCGCVTPRVTDSIAQLL